MINNHLSLCHTTSIHQAAIIGLSYFFLIFGLTSIINHLTKYVLDGKPRHRFIKILHFYAIVCIGVGIILSISTVRLLDPDKIQYTLKDANLVPQFIQFWIKMVIFAMGIAAFYGIPYYVIYFVFISLIFKEYNTN